MLKIYTKQNDLTYWKQYVSKSFNLSWEDREDVINVLLFWFYKNRNSLCRGKIVYRKITAAVKKIKKQNRSIIPVPPKSLQKNYFNKMKLEDRPIYYDKPSISDCNLRWSDFSFKSLTKQEYRFLFMYFKQDCSINFISKYSGVSRYKIMNIINEATKKMLNDNLFFLKGA